MKKIITGDYRLVRNLNSQIVLNLIRTDAPIYGADLAKITGMQPSTIMKILRDLEKQGLIQKVGRGASSRLGGRRPVLYEICGDYGYIIGIKAELNELQGVLINLNSHILASNCLPVEAKLSVKQLLDNIDNLIEGLLRPQGIQYSDVIGVGIGVSGMVDHTHGIIVKTDLVSEDDLPLRDLLQQRYQFKILLENDANAAAMYEKWYNQGQEVANFVYALVIIDKKVFGIGYGIIIDGCLYRGAHMFAGETKPHPISIRQLLDNIVGPEEPAITLAGRTIDKAQVSIEDLIAAAKSDDQTAKAYFQELAKIIGAELAQVVFLLDPAMILLGGEVMQAESILLPAIGEAIQEKIGRQQEFKLAVSPSKEAVALGVASLILMDIFQPADLKTNRFYPG